MTQQETLDFLRSKLPQGTELTTVLLSTRSDINGNFHRKYHVLAAIDGTVWVLDGYLKALGFEYSHKQECISTNSPSSNLVDRISYALYGNTNAFRHQYL